MCAACHCHNWLHASLRAQLRFVNFADCSIWLHHWHHSHASARTVLAVRPNDLLMLTAAAAMREAVSMAVALAKSILVTTVTTVTTVAAVTSLQIHKDHLARPLGCRLLNPWSVCCPVGPLHRW